MGDALDAAAANVMVVVKSRRAAGRLTRSKLLAKRPLAKRPHSGGHWPGKKLNNVEEDLGKTYFQHLCLNCILAKSRKNLDKVQQSVGKFCEI